MRFQRLAPCSRSIVALFACAWMALCGAIHFPSPALAHDDAHAIRSLIGATWDKPNSKVETDPVVVSGNYAVASWTQGARGGRALLKKDVNSWSVVLCSGDPLKKAAWLVEAGVPQADADRLATDLGTFEARVPSERRVKFSLFEGTVPGGADGHHAPSHHDHHSHP